MSLNHLKCPCCGGEEFELHKRYESTIFIDDKEEEIDVLDALGVVRFDCKECGNVLFFKYDSEIIHQYDLDVARKEIEKIHHNINELYKEIKVLKSSLDKEENEVAYKDITNRIKRLKRKIINEQKQEKQVFERWDLNQSDQESLSKDLVKFDKWYFEI